jgi:hypothetical protein
LPIVYGKPIKLPTKGKAELSDDELPIFRSADVSSALEKAGETPALQLPIPANEIPPAKIAEPLWSILPPLAFAAAALSLGLYLPQPLLDLLHSAATAVGAE